MKKALIVAVVGLIVIIVGVGVYLYNSVDPIVKGAIEKYGSEITGTKVSVSSVDISLKSGLGTIRGISVANPDGFPDGEAFKLEEITVDIDVASLNKDPIVIQEVKIAAPDVSAIMDAIGNTNLGVIKKHVDAYQAGSRGASSGKKGAGYEKRIRIERFTFEEGHLAGDATALGAKEIIHTDMPPIQIRNLGGSSGAAPDAIAKEITNTFLAVAKKTAVEEMRGRAIDKLEDKAKKALDEILK